MSFWLSDNVRYDGRLDASPSIGNINATIHTAAAVIIIQLGPDDKVLPPGE